MFRRRAGFVLLLVGIALLSAGGTRAIMNAKALSDYEKLVPELEAAPYQPGQRQPGLDHARSALTSLRSLHAVRWQPGGYMFESAIAGVVGLGLCAMGFRVRTA